MAARNTAARGGLISLNDKMGNLLEPAATVYCVLCTVYCACLLDPHIVALILLSGGVVGESENVQNFSPISRPTNLMGKTIHRAFACNLCIASPLWRSICRRMG